MRRQPVNPHFKGVIPPGVDLVLPQPGAHCPRRDVRHTLLLDGHLRAFLPRPPRPRFAVCAWRTTSHRGHLGSLKRRKGAAGAGPRRITHTVGLLPALSPVLDGLDTAPHLPGDLRVPPGGLLMREEEHPGTLDFGIRGRGAGAEMMQMRLLLRRDRLVVRWRHMCRL
jgi:hypothetical protein